MTVLNHPEAGSFLVDTTDLDTGYIAVKPLREVLADALRHGFKHVIHEDAYGLVEQSAKVATAEEAERHAEEKAPGTLISHTGAGWVFTAPQVLNL